MGRPATVRSGWGASKLARIPTARAAATPSEAAGTARSSALRTPANGRIMRGDLTAEGLDDENAPADSRPAGRRRARCRAAGDVHEGHRSDSPAVMSELPPARADGADVAAHVPGRSPLGALDQAARHRAHDAALGHRPAHRTPELQERSDAARG